MVFLVSVKPTTRHKEMLTTTTIEMVWIGIGKEMIGMVARQTRWVSNGVRQGEVLNQRKTDPENERSRCRDPTGWIRTWAAEGLQTTRFLIDQMASPLVPM